MPLLVWMEPPGEDASGPYRYYRERILVDGTIEVHVADTVSPPKESEWRTFRQTDPPTMQYMRRETDPPFVGIKNWMQAL